MHLKLHCRKKNKYGIYGIYKNKYGIYGIHFLHPSMGYRKCGTRARVFFKALAHGNSENEIRETEEEGKKRSVSMERSTEV